jgi:uncharacterized protein
MRPLPSIAFAALAFFAGAPSAWPAQAKDPLVGQVIAQTDAENSLSAPVHTLRIMKLMRAFHRTWRQQFDFSCGSAALATLLTFQYNTPVDETTVFKQMYAVGDQPQIRQKGFSMLDMKRFLESHGYTADGVKASLDTLMSVHIPAIALISDHGYRHFVVVKGADKTRVLLGDPALGLRVMPRRDFEKARVADLFFVIRSNRDQALFNSPQDWNDRLVEPLNLNVVRNSLALEILTIPNATSF